MNANYPDDFRYTREHEWVKVDGDTGTIGLTFYAQEELGDIVYLDLPPVGTRLEQGKTAGSVESVKAVSDVYAPVSGEVIAINEELAKFPEKLNQDPHGGAWLMRVKLAAPEQVQALLTAEEYRQLVAKEKH
jgi:glycine cleavage system H protein